MSDLQTLFTSSCSCTLQESSVDPNAWGSAAPVGYTDTGLPVYDANAGTGGKVWDSTDNGIYEYDIDGDSWTNLGGPPTYNVHWAAYLASSDNGLIALSGDKKTAYRWTGAVWTSVWSGGGYPAQHMVHDPVNNDVYIVSVDRTVGSQYVLYKSTDGSSYTDYDAVYTNLNYANQVIPRYDSSSDVIIFPRNSSLQSDIAKRFNGSTYSDFDNTLGGSYHLWYSTGSPYMSATKFYVGHRNVTAGTDCEIYEYNAGVRTSLGYPGADASLWPFPVVCNGSLYACHVNQTDPWIYKHVSGTTWSQYAQLTGDGANFYQSCCVVGTKMIFMGSTGFLAIDG